MLNARTTTIDASNFLQISVQAIHKRLKAKNLILKKNQNRAYFSHEIAKELFELNFPNKIICFQIVKGGVGKTELVLNTAIRANLYGAKVLCVDLDQQGNLTNALNVNAKSSPVMVDIFHDKAVIEDTVINVSPGFDLIPSRLENSVLDNSLALGRYPLDKVYKEMFMPLKEKYDLIFIDCPPALGQSVTAAALASDVIIAPVNPDDHSITGLEIITEELRTIEKRYRLKLDLRIIFNKFDTRTTNSHLYLSTLLKHDYYGDLLFKTYIRYCQDFQNALRDKKTIFYTLKKTDAKEDIDLFTRELLGLDEIREKKSTVDLMEEFSEEK